MKIETDHCPICRIEQVDFDTGPEHDHGNQAAVKCARCGNFVIGGMAAFRLRGETKPDLALSAWIRWQELLGNAPPRVMQENLEQIRLALPKYGVQDRGRELLKALTIQSQHAGYRVTGKPFL